MKASRQLKWISLLLLAVLWSGCNPEYIQSFVENERYAKQHNLHEKSMQKKKLLKKGWRKYDRGKYKKSLKKGLLATRISTAGRVSAEPTDVAYSSTLLVAQSYFKLNLYDSALYAIEEFDNGYFTDAQHHTLDSLEMKIFEKMLGCDSLRSEIKISLDSVRKLDYAKSVYCFVIPLKNCGREIVLHPNSRDYGYVMGPYANPWRMNTERAGRFKTYFLKSDLYLNICE